MVVADYETFDLAQNQVYVLMERDSFVRFITSTESSKVNERHIQHQTVSKSNAEYHQNLLKSMENLGCHNSKFGKEHLLSNKPAN